MRRIILTDEEAVTRSHYALKLSDTEWLIIGKAAAHPNAQTSDLAQLESTGANPAILHIREVVEIQTLGSTGGLIKRAAP